VTSGEITVGDVVRTQIDVERRRAISRSHTATHLVHRAFRGALGETAAQAGSENSPGRFRFDFTAVGAVPPAVLADVEHEVNTVLTDDLEVRAIHTSLAQAREMGALALFGEKYGEQVRVVEVGDYSRELCGGTHVPRSGQLGLIKIMGESSIGSGIRRVEALVGIDAFGFLARESLLVSQLAEQLKAPRADLADRVAGIISRLRDAERELQRIQAERLAGDAADVAATAQDVRGVAYVAHRLADGTPADGIRKLALDVRAKLAAGRPAVVAAVGVPADRPAVVIAVNEAARAAGVTASELIGVATSALGGRGGGRDDIAQGGGSVLDAQTDSVIEAAFDAVRGVIDRIAGQGSVT
jgi:alanyl-tRNA synthetase